MIRRVLGGVAWGAGAATVLSLLVALAGLVRGGEALARQDLTLGQVVEAYYLCGLLGGALFGAVRPLARGMLGAGLVGALVGAAVYAGAGWFIVAPDELRSALPWGLLAGLLVGGGVGLLMGRARKQIEELDSEAMRR